MRSHYFNSDFVLGRGNHGHVLIKQLPESFLRPNPPEAHSNFGLRSVKLQAVKRTDNKNNVDNLAKISNEL
eukprot:266870-Pyramimonas_sp.AAC.1